MKTVRDGCQLQPNATSIKLSDQVEQLDALIAEEGDGSRFFSRTAITQGMQDLITEGTARLAGVSNQAIFHLKQAMGGGKTHLLVGFGLLAKNPELRKTWCGGTFYAQSFGAAKTAAFNGRNSPPGFFWGEIATQLGKGDQFAPFWTAGPKAPDEKDWLRYGRKLEEAGKSKVANRGAEGIADEIAATYPFQPRLKNLIALFKENERFKQTRGLIELVSRLLRSVWDRKDNDVFLIGPQHFDLGIPEVRDKLTEISGWARCC